MLELATPPKTGTKSCPSVPAHPANANVNANMAQTNAAKPIPLVGGSALTASTVNAASWFNNVCCWSSPWNYQADANGNWQPQYDDFGNFNYGATGTALGLPQAAVMWAGGLVKNINYWSKGQANPYRNQPYMNDRHKMSMIAQGIQYAQNGCN